MKPCLYDCKFNRLYEHAKNGDLEKFKQEYDNNTINIYIAIQALVNGHVNILQYIFENDNKHILYPTELLFEPELHHSCHDLPYINALGWLIDNVFHQDPYIDNMTEYVIKHQNRENTEIMIHMIYNRPNKYKRLIHNSTKYMKKIHRAMC